jgi:hypothetical protein
MTACTDCYPHDAHIGECEYCLCIKPVPVAWTQSVLPSPTPCAFDQLPEGDREMVLQELMKRVTAFTQDEVVLTSFLNRRPNERAYYEERIAESRRMAVAWRAAAEKLQTK